MNALERRIALTGDDGMEILAHLGTTPVCAITLAIELGFDGQRFKEAVHAIRESGISLITCDYETICIYRPNWREALDRATWYVDRALRSRT